MDTRYAGAVGKIRAMETRLLNKARLEALLDADTGSEILQKLGDIVMPDDRGDTDKPEVFERVLDYQMEITYDLFRRLSLHPEVSGLFFLKNDIHNMKILLKAMYKGKQADEALLSTGAIPVDNLKKMVNEQNFKQEKGMHPFLVKALHESLGQFETGNLQRIDIILDKVYYDIIFDVLHKSALKSELLEKFFRIEVDLNNILIFMRLKVNDREKQLLQDALISHGTLEKEIFVKLFNDTIDNFVQKLSVKRYAGIIEEGVSNYKQTQTLGYLEKLCDDYKLEFLKQAKWVAFGMEPLIGYLLAKEREIINIRGIEVGRRNLLAVARIKESLRITYV